MEKAEKSSLFTKDFTLVVIGQIISIFGNNILRFALPLYILDQSGSEALFGIVSALSFIPMILMSPVGGIIADRVNKQRIMVVLDFSTAALIGGFMLLNGQVALAPLVVLVLMLLYGIQGAYQPAVQASIPLLATTENIVPANAVVNIVNSLAGLVGPVLGGMLYGTYGLWPVLVVSFVSFAFSAVLELFIRIPHKKQPSSGSVLAIVKTDMTVSFRFMFKEKPSIAKSIGLVVFFNLFLSSMIVIGMPVLITRTLGMSTQLYGASEGVLALGGLAGGVMAGVLGKKINVQSSWIMLLACAASVLPTAIALLVGAPAFVTYPILTVSGGVMMIASTLFSVLILAYLQAQTPMEITGKVISCVMALTMCAQPVGQALYGVLFEKFAGAPWVILLGATVVAMLIALASKQVFAKIDTDGETTDALAATVEPE